MSEYNGPVAFVDGVHYPAVEVEGDPTEPDENGNRATHADLSRPLRWVSGETYRDADEGEPLHNDVHHQSDLELEVGGEG